MFDISASVPCADQNAARVRMVAQQVDDLLDLIDGAAIWRWPAAPLYAIDGSQLTVFVRPFIPDRDAVFLQVLNVRITAQEPQQLVDDRFGMQLLGSDHGKTLAEIEAHLVTEHAECSGAGSIFLAYAGIAYVAHHRQVLLHVRPLPPVIDSCCRRGIKVRRRSESSVLSKPVPS